MSTTSEPRVLVVVSGWPRLSEVFALNEITALRRRGLLAGLVATKRGETGLVHPAAREITDDCVYLPEGDVRAQADALAKIAMDVGPTALHAYFAHLPAEIAAAAADRCDLPFSFSVHALDARRAAGGPLASRAAQARAVIACNPDVASLVEDVTGTRPLLVRHGVDLGTFRPRASVPTEMIKLLAVGRFVPKKGFDALLDALELVERPVVLRIVGGGPSEPELRARAERSRHRVELLGRLTHGVLPWAYANADAVVVPSVVAPDGDRDGLPNVVLEAMASGRPVIASEVAAIATAVEDGVTGLLVPPGDPAALAAAITSLADDPARRSRLGTEARATVERSFALDRCADEFCDALVRAHA